MHCLLLLWPTFSITYLLIVHEFSSSLLDSLNISLSEPTPVVVNPNSMMTTNGSDVDPGSRTIVTPPPMMDSSPPPPLSMTLKPASHPPPATKNINVIAINPNDLTLTKENREFKIEAAMEVTLDLPTMENTRVREEPSSDAVTLAEFLGEVPIRSALEGHDSRDLKREAARGAMEDGSILSRSTLETTRSRTGGE